MVSELYSSANISCLTGTYLVLLSLVFAQKSSQQSVFSHESLVLSSLAFSTSSPLQFLSHLMQLWMITHAVCSLFTLVNGLMLSYIGVSATWVWVAECPLVGGDSGDSPLMRGLSRGSCWGRGATDSSVLPWFSWSTWKDSSALIETRHWIDMLRIDPTSTLILLIH